MKRNYYFLLFLLLPFVACVPKQKYNALRDQKDALLKEYNQIRDTRAERQGLLDSIYRTNNSLATLQAELEDYKQKFFTLYQNNEEMTRQLNLARSENGEMVATATASQNSLQNELAARVRELDERERAIRLMEAQAKINQGNIDELKGSVGERERKIQQLTAALNAKDAEMDRLRTKVLESLVGFSNSDLTVEKRNGRVYVSLSQNLLFSKGSDVIDPKGIDALRKLANALNANADIQITVEGHTDADGTADKNWLLSTARSVSVVKVLAANRVDARRITASGRGMYAPIAPNDVETNKTLNRRTEIILSPKLDEVYNILK